MDTGIPKTPWAATVGRESERDKDRNVARLLPVFLARAGFQLAHRDNVSMPDTLRALKEVAG